MFQVLRELELYQISVAFIERDGIVLAAGIGQQHQTDNLSKGIAIVLRGPAVNTWNAIGEQWSLGVRDLSQLYYKQEILLQNVSISSLIVMHQLTYLASRDDKGKFLDKLHQALDAIPPYGCCIIGGTLMLGLDWRRSVAAPMECRRLTM